MGKQAKSKKSAAIQVSPDDKSHFFRPSAKSQLASWSVDKLGAVDGKPTAAAEIYFTTDEAALDRKDEKVLEYLCRELSYFTLGNRVYIDLKGYADYRGSESDNMLLALDRINSVKKAIDSRLGKGTSNYTYTHEAIGELPNNRKLAEQRKVVIYFKSGAGKTSEGEKEENKPEKIEIPQIERIKPDSDKKPKIDRSKKSDGLEKGAGVVSMAAKPAGLANALLGPTAVGGGLAIAGQVAFIVNGLIVLGEDPNKIHAQVAGAVYGIVIGAYNAAKVHAIFKNDRINPPSKIIKNWKLATPALPKPVPRETTFNNAFKKAYKDFIQNSAEAFRAWEDHKFEKQYKQDHIQKQKRNLKHTAADRYIAIMNAVSAAPDETLQKVVSQNLKESLAAKHHNYWKMAVKGKAYTYNFD